MNATCLRVLHKIGGSNKAKVCVYFYFLGMHCMYHRGEYILHQVPKLQLYALCIPLDLSG